MEIITIFENKPIKRIYGLMGNINITTYNNNISIVRDYKSKGTTEKYLDSPKASSSLKMVLINDSILTKESSECSVGELKRISLAKALIENKEYLVFDYFEKELTQKELEYFKRLWKKLTSEYNKTIIIFTNDIKTIWSVAEELIIVDKYKVINTISKENYDQLMANLDKPPIYEFIDLMRNKGMSIENYRDPKDLLKAIYRIKEQS